MVTGVRLDEETAPAEQVGQQNAVSFRPRTDPELDEITPCRAGTAQDFDYHAILAVL